MALSYAYSSSRQLCGGLTIGDSAVGASMPSWVVPAAGRLSRLAPHPQHQARGWRIPLTLRILVEGYLRRARHYARRHTRPLPGSTTRCAQDIQPTPGGACATTGRIRRNMVVDDSHRCSRRVCRHRRASPEDLGDRIRGSTGCWLSLMTPLPTVKMTGNGDPVEQIRADFAGPDGAAALVASADSYGYFDTWHLRQ